MRKAVDRDVAIDILMLSPEYLTTENKYQQEEIRSILVEQFPTATVRIADRVLPWRGTLIDPDLQYETGQGLLLVEQEEVPNHLRQAAVTENPAFIAGLWQYFDLL
jgi:hypothetical protein